MEHAYTQSGQIKDAIFQMIKDRKLDEAAKLYTRCQEDIGYLLINQMDGQQVPKNSLAKMFYIAKDFEKSALVFEQAGIFDKAAVLYAKGDDYLMAAEMYSRVQDFANAALMYEKNGSYNQAAELFAKVGNHERAASNFERDVNNFLAGKMYYQLGKHDKAMELLQKVAQSDHEYLDATVMIGQILGSQGFHDLAVRKYLAIIQDAPVNADNMSIYYELAALYIKLGRSEEAKQILENILTIDFNFKDASQLLQKAQSGIAQVAEVVEELAPIEELSPVELAPVDLAPVEEESASIVSMMDGFEFLQETPLFTELNLQEMRQFWTAFEPASFNEGDAIITQDTTGEAFYILIEGTVKVERTDEGKTKHLADLAPGAFFGEMSLMDDMPTSASIIATSTGEMMRVSRQQFETLMEANDRIALKIYRAFCRTLMDRLRATNANFAKFEKKKEKELASLFGG